MASRWRAGDPGPRRLHQLLLSRVVPPYQRDAGGTFQQVYDSVTDHRIGFGLSVGVDGSRVAIANTGLPDPNGGVPFDNVLTVWDFASSPPSRLFDVTKPYSDTAGTGYFDVWFRQVDISGDVLVYENCCPQPEVHIERLGTAGYQPEAVVPIAPPSTQLSAIPNAILLAVPTQFEQPPGVWHTLVHDNNAWAVGADIAAPDPVAATFARPAIAVGNEVLIGGDNVLHVLTVETGSTEPVAKCLDRPVTVDVAAGDAPTAGDDVILGTEGADVIDAGAGNDIVCGNGGDDQISGGPGGDVIFTGSRNDRISGGADGDLIASGSGQRSCAR